MILNLGPFTPSGDIGRCLRYFGFSHLRGGGCYWLLVSGGQGCWSVHYTAQFRTQDSFHCRPSLGPKCPQDWDWEILASCNVSWPSLLLFGLLCTTCKIFLHPFKITDQVLPSLLFFFFFFNVDHFLKSWSNLLKYCFCFVFWFFSREACAILAPQARDRICTPCIGRQSPDHWSVREVPLLYSFKNRLNMTIV